MPYLISLFLIVASSIYVGIKCYPKDKILASTLITFGTLVVYGFIYIGILFTIRSNSLTLDVLHLAASLGFPLIIYLAKYRPGQNEQEDQQEPTLFEQLEDNAPKSFEEFWNDPNQSYTQGKIILLVLAVIFVILSGIWSLIQGIF